MTTDILRVESPVAVLAEKHRLSMFARDHSRGQVDEQRGRLKRSAARLAPSIPCPQKVGALQCLFTTGHDGCLLWWLYSGLGAEQQPRPQLKRPAADSAQAWPDASANMASREVKWA